MKKRLILITAVIGLLVSCPNPDGSHPNNGPDNPYNPDQKTLIVFDNTQGICTASVYNDYQRRDEDKLAEIPAGGKSGAIEYSPGVSVPFYFSYNVNLKGVNGFSLNYVPKEVGKDQTQARIDEGVITTIPIPKLEETVSSPDALLSEKSYLLIQNNSSYSFQLHRGTSILTPESSSASLVNSGERALYTINPGAASPYRLLVGADYKEFSGSIVSFEAGSVYSFIFDGNVSLVAEVEIILENVAGVPKYTPGPDAPNAPVVTAGDSLITLRWTAVQGAENYEVYVSTTQSPPASPVRTVAGTATVLTGLSNKTVYYIWIKSVNASGSSDFSPFSLGIPWPANEAPAVPARPVIIPGINQLTVNWDECGGAVSYEVYKNTTTTSPSAPEITTDKTSAVIKNLENEQIYYIWVRAVNNVGKSDYSPVEAGTPTIPTKPPAAPARPGLTVGNQKLTVSWQAVELAASYEIWLGTTSDSAQAAKQGADITGTETVISGLTNETTYYVWIKAKNVVGTSGFSPSANAKPSAFAVLPDTPAAPSVTAGSRELIISWPSIEGALSYEVWMGATNNPASAVKYGADVSGTSVTITGLTNETTYYIWIKAKNNIGVSDFSPRASGTPSAFAATPSAPQTAPTVIAGSGQLTVSWQTVEGASVYEVWAGADTNPTLATKRGGDVTGLSSVITGLSNGTTYYVWIKAKNAVGTSNFSPMATGTPSVFFAAPQAPAAPSVSIGNGQITVSWAAAAGATAYEVWTATTNNSASATKNGADISDALSVTIGNLSNGTTYYVWIKAKNSVGASTFSSAASGKPIANATAPTLSASNDQLSVTWTAIAGADQYEIFCGNGITPPQAASQTVTAPATTATISGLVNGTTYNVWVRGRNATGTGAMSGAASAKPVGNMGPVTLYSGNGQLTANWTEVFGADQYDVYYSATSTIPGSSSQTVSVTTATITGLTNGTTYYVWVKPKNANGAGNINTAVSGKPLGTPGAPTVSPAYKQLLVTWTAVAGADEYEVYCGTSNNPTTLAATTAGTTATITGLTNGTTYYVRLRAKNTNGVSGYGPSANQPLNVTPGLYRGAEKIGNQNLANSLTYISANAVSGDDFYIVLGADESSSPITLGYSNKTIGITLLGYGGEREITLNANGSLFRIDRGVTLTLDENITLMGRSANTASLIYINTRGELIVNDGVKIIGNKYTSSSSYSVIGGGGVYVGSNGTFSMSGGIITGNTSSYSYAYGGGGGGVFVSGTFNMKGGAISGNNTNVDSSIWGGGVSVPSEGTFIMDGGKISGNSGTGIYSIGTITMNGGKIIANESTGVIARNGIFTMNGGEISNNTNGGVWVGNIYNDSTIKGIFIMNEGKITGNTANSGGGVYVNFGTFTMSGGEITGNTASSYGGGVYVNNGTFTKSGGGTITGYAGDTVNGNVVKNSSGVVQNNRGHAVYVDSKRRETTAGPTVNLDSSKSGAAGGWE